MKTYSILKVVGLGLAISSMTVFRAGAVYVYESMPTGLAANDVAGNGSAYYEVGNEFAVNSAINVTSVGFFDPNGGGNTVPIAVAIFQYQAGSWSQVAGTYNDFASGTSASFGATAMQSLSSPITLGAGTYAIVAGGGGQTGNGYWNSTQPNPGSSTPTFDNGGGLITQIDQAQYALVGSSDIGLTAWPTASGVWLSPYGAGTFEFSAVPEVQTFAVAGAAMLGLIFVGRKVAARRMA